MEQINQEEEVLERDSRAAETPEEYIPIGPEYIQSPRGVWGSFSRELGTRERPLSGYSRGCNSHT